MGRGSRRSGSAAGSSGRKDWGYGKEYGDTVAVELVHWALDHGVNLIDTAEIYARGVSEAIVGRALEGRRDEAFLATKVVPTWPTADRVEEHGRLSSMRLGVKSIDLYQQHWPNPAVPIASTMEGHAPAPGRGDHRARRREQLRGRAGGRPPSVRSARPVLSNQVRFNLHPAQARRGQRARTRRRTTGS